MGGLGSLFQGVSELGGVGAFAILGLAWGPKVDLGPHFGGERGVGLFLGCAGDALSLPSLCSSYGHVPFTHAPTLQPGRL